MDAAVRLGQAFDDQKGGCGAHSAVSIRGVRVLGFDVGLRRCVPMVSSTPTIPFGSATTISTITAPSTNLDKSVWLTSQILSALNTMAPTTAPDTVSTPPSSTLTSASTESEMPRLSGNTLPFRYANSAPAMPATVPAITKAVH